MKNNRENRFHIHHMRNAVNAASMSYAEICKVGAVIVRDNRTIVNSWNGTIRGSDNCCEEHVITCKCGEVHIVKLLNDGDSSNNFRSFKCSCGKTCTPNNCVVKFRTKRSVVHAEENAILYAAKTGIPLAGSTLYSTYAPCIRCARMIISCGISKVFYMYEFKNTLGLDLLKEHWVAADKLDADIINLS